MLGSEANGLYVAAYKVPNVIMLFSTLFTEAWQLSAVTDGGRNSPGRAKFFSQVFLSYQSLLFIVAGGLIYCCKFVMMVLTLSGKSAFNAAWQYIPLLVVATVFSCFVTFLGSVYMVEKRSGESFFTMLVGAVLNLALNWFLIPVWAPTGPRSPPLPAICWFRHPAFSTRRYIAMDLHLGRMTVTLPCWPGRSPSLSEAEILAALVAVLWRRGGAFNFCPLRRVRRLLARRRRRS